MTFDPSLLECELTSVDVNFQQFPHHPLHPFLQKEADNPAQLIFKRSPTTYRKPKQHDARNSTAKPNENLRQNLSY